MPIADFFRPVPLIEPDEVRRLLKERKLGEYNVVDVRESHEYAEGHLPGATHIPLAQLSTRGPRELDPEKPTVTY